MKTELPAVSLMPMSKLVLSMVAVSLLMLRACITFTVWYELDYKRKRDNHLLIYRTSSASLSTSITTTTRPWVDMPSRTKAKSSACTSVSYTITLPQYQSKLIATAHCLDTIRQVLMCNVDTGVLGQVWYDRKNPSAFPDFNTKHTCKNYDDIKKWSEKLQVSIF